VKGPERRAAIEERTLSKEASGPHGIAAGSDGALWFTEMRGDRIGRITTGGEVSTYSLRTVEAGPTVIAAGPDSAFWSREDSTLLFTHVTHRTIANIEGTRGSINIAIISVWPYKNPTSLYFRVP
jgi:streptogramin lyase